MILSGKLFGKVGYCQVYEDHRFKACGFLFFRPFIFLHIFILLAFIWVRQSGLLKRFFCIVLWSHLWMTGEIKGQRPSNSPMPPFTSCYFYRWFCVTVVYFCYLFLSLTDRCAFDETRQSAARILFIPSYCRLRPNS